MRVLAAVGILGPSLFESKRSRRSATRCDGKVLYRQSADDPNKVLQWHQKAGGYIHPSLRATQLPGRGWGLQISEAVPAGSVLVRTPPQLLWVAHESDSLEVAEPLAPGDEETNHNQSFRAFRVLFFWDSLCCLFLAKIGDAHYVMIILSVDFGCRFGEVLPMTDLRAQDFEKHNLRIWHCYQNGQSA